MTEASEVGLLEMAERLRNQLPDKLITGSSAKRDFKNEHGREITAGIEIGRMGGFCRLYLYGPDSGIDSYTTRFELAMLYEVLREIFHEATTPPPPVSEEWEGIAREFFDVLSRAREVINACYVTMGVGNEGRAANLAFIDVAQSRAHAALAALANPTEKV